MTTKAKPPRAKNMQYVQQLDHLPAKTVDHLRDVIEKKLVPKEYALILHDRDIDDKGNPEKPHVHVMLCFDNARYVASVAKTLGDKPQYVEVWSGDRNNGFSYLIHATKEAQSKHQYDVSEVTANFDFEERLNQISHQVKTGKKHKEIDLLLDNVLNGLMTIEDAESILTGSELAKYHRQFKIVEEQRQKKKAQATREKLKASGKPIKTIWIAGPAGIGKTSLAKTIGGSQAFFTGADNDPFQEYRGQEILILDDFRPGTERISYSELLRIIDPYGVDATASARYENKILACEMFIITCPYTPYEFYRQLHGQGKVNLIDSFEQLNRRIALTVLMDEDEICEVQFDKTTFQYVPIPNRPVRHNPYSTKNRPAPTAANIVTLDNLLAPSLQQNAPSANAPTIKP